ncbi:MAG: hypothetical protein ABEJ65_01895 [bacterium]
MSEWEDIDFAITGIVTNDEGHLMGVEGFVVENGELRDESIRVDMGQVADYLSQDGVFYTAHPGEEGIRKGAPVTIKEQNSHPVLITPEGTPEEDMLKSLPVV